MKSGELTRTELPDRGCKGLYLVVQPGGAKSWAVRYRYKGKPPRARASFKSSSAMNMYRTAMRR
jgi:hypothetical protein